MLKQKVATKSFSLELNAVGNPSAKRMVIVLPGKLDTKDYGHMIGHVEAAASLGYFALSFDPPGTWGSEKPEVAYTISNYLKAVIELIEYYGNKETVLIGHSRGGSVTKLAALHSDRVIGIVPIMAPPSFTSSPSVDAAWQNSGVRKSSRDIPGAPGSFKEYTLPYEHEVDSRQYDTSEGIKTLAIPKLFIVGKDDDVVLPSSVEKEYLSAAAPKEYRVLNSGHDYRNSAALIDEANEIIVDFLCRYFSADT